jgi:hypothetical protein
MNEATTTNGTRASAAELQRWPTASLVAARLGCARTQVYKLEKRGKLRGAEVRMPNGKKLRRFDPQSVEELAAGDELEELLDDDGDDDDAGDDVNGSKSHPALKLAAKVVADSRTVALDARRGQQEAFELVSVPTREFTKLLLGAIEQREKRIAELEEKLNKFHDEQRAARAEEREVQFEMNRVERQDQRKDQFFKMFTDNLPVLLEQLKSAVSAGAGPFAEWMKKRSPAQQAKMIRAIEAVIGEDEPSAATSSAEKGGSDDAH